MSATACTSPSVDVRLAERLGGAVVGVRTELDVSRHVFRDGVGYVVRDPVSFKTHRFGIADYAVLTALNPTRTLGETFDALVAEGRLDAGDEESFYGFVVDLHRMGLLTLPINDAESVYRRYEQRRRARRRSLVMSVFFLRVPLVNPDRALTVLAPVARVLFSRWAFIGWALLMASAAGLAVVRWNELSQPLLTAVTGGNLYLLWATLVGLKVIHEAGHALACKAFGGHVPEMGAYLVLLTPCAYVDATDSWSFAQAWKRVVVGLAGVYFESAAGACALGVWAWTQPGILNTVAYQAVILSTVVTIGFNLNPLMKYDGYYIVSDLVGIPNLRARAQEQVSLLVRILAVGRREGGKRVRLSLLAFGLSLVVYRVTVVLSICTLIATRYYFVGLLLASGYLAVSLAGVGLKCFHFACRSALPRSTRVRTLCSTGVLAALCAGVMLAAPVRAPIGVWGVAERENEVVLRAPERARVEAASSCAGDRVSAGGCVVRLASAELDAELVEARAALEAAEFQFDAAYAESPDVVGPAAAAVEAARQRVVDLERRVGSLAMAAPFDGEVCGVERVPIGATVEPGDRIATVVSGGWRATLLFDEYALEASRIRRGERIVVRSVSDPTTPIEGRVESIEFSGSRTIAEWQLSAGGGGPIAVSGPGRQAGSPYFRVRVALDDSPALAHGGTLRAQMWDEPRAIGQRVLDVAQRFLMRVRIAQTGS